jgi:hypothetical protein
MIKKYPWIYALVMIVIIVAVDILFLRHRFLARLISNIAIALVFVLIYFVFLKRK